MINAKVFVGGKYQDIGAVKAQNNPQWLRDILTAEEAGASSPTLYSKSSWAYSCINIRADALSGIPWEVREKAKGEEQGDVVDENHELVVMLTEVNPEMNWVDLLRATEADLNVNGKAYWLKIHPGKQKKSVAGLQRLNPNKMEAKTTRAGIDHFEFEIGGKKEPIAREEIVFFRLYDPRDDFGAIPPLEVARADIEAEASADAYLADFFQNYAMPAHIINFQDGNIDKADLRRAERRWLAKFRGKGERHKAQFTSTPEMQVETLGYSIKDLAMGEVREEARRAICAAFRVPMTLAGASEAANFATMHEQRQSMYTEVIIPRSLYIAGVINAELVQMHFEDSIEFVFRADTLEVMQPDREKERESISGLVKSGTITPEAGALALGFTEDDVGLGPFIQMMPGTIEEMEKAEEIAAGKEKSMLQQDLEKWCRKSLKKVKKGKGALVAFESEHIPLGLGESISGALEEAQSRKEVKAIFHGVFEYENEPYTRKRDVLREQFDELKSLLMNRAVTEPVKIENVLKPVVDAEEIAEALKGTMGKLEKRLFGRIDGLKGDLDLEEDMTAIAGLVKELTETVKHLRGTDEETMKALNKTLKVLSKKIGQKAELKVTVDAGQNIINIPKRVGSSEKQVIKRDAKKLIKETTTEIVDHYED